MMKILVGFFGICALIGIIAAGGASHIETDHAQDAQQAAALAKQRPLEIQKLKRPAVRAACSKHSEWDIEDCQTMDKKQVSIGMTSEQAILSWGKPDRINSTVLAGGRRDQWVYGENSYLYVDNAVVKSIQTSH